MHLGARGFVHAELIDPETRRRVALDGRRRGRARADPSAHRAAPLLRFRTRDHVARADEPVPVRAHGAARALHRPDRRHADRPRRQRLPVGGPRGGRRLRARGQRPHPRQAAGARASSRTRRSRSASSSRPARRRTPALAEAIRERLRERAGRADARGARAVGEPAAQRLQVADWSSTEGRPMRKLQSQGVHHITHRRRRPADVDRLLGGRARHAVRVRAAEPRQRVGEPSLLRPGRRAPDHHLHQRGAHAATRAHADRPGLRAPPRVRACRRRPSARRSSASTSGGSSTAASRTAASWTRSTSRIRSAC